MVYLDIVLDEARRRAWEDLTDDQRAAYLDAASRKCGRPQSKSIIKRWSVVTGPRDEKK